MPFADPARPALGLSLLKACLEARDIACDVVYFNLAYARLLGLDAYRQITEETPPAALAGEWVFKGASTEAADDLNDKYLQGILEDRWRVQERALESVRRARSAAPGFIRGAYESVRWEDYGLVGFGSTVAQNVASLSLAELVKKSHPEIPIVFGGHNGEGSMGVALLEQHACVEYAGPGDADQALPSLAAALAKGGTRAASAVPGVISREGPSRAHRLTLRSSVLSGLPVPDHGDYFVELRRQGLHEEITPVVPLEMSRGCWWAVRRPCAFCGINGERREYATKTDARVIEEMQALLGTWPGLRVDVVDNVVPRRFLKRVLPVLKGGHGVSLRIRPDATDEELESIAAAGGWVTCGIESLDSHILELLGKGVDARRNLRLLERCARLGLRVDWNLLHGVPGEIAQDYARQADLVETLGELQPPRAVMPIQLERWSEYWDRAAVLGFGQASPSTAYEHVYALDREALSRIAYFFDHEYRPPLGVTLHVARLQRAIGVWRAGWGQV
jgi:ribosomal peptide maturation radical SAM protein 1